MTARLEERLNANLVASNARTATASGARCAVCRRRVRAGDRVADLADGRLVHIAKCTGLATIDHPDHGQQ